MYYSSPWLLMANGTGGGGGKEDEIGNSAMYVFRFSMYVRMVKSGMHKPEFMELSILQLLGVQGGI